MSIMVEVMDSTNGRPAAGVQVTLLREVDGRWDRQGTVCTDDDGQAAGLASATSRGQYRLMLDLDQYFAGYGVTPFQSRVEVVFRVFHPSDRVRLLLMVTASSCGAQIVLSGDHDDSRQSDR